MATARKIKFVNDPQKSRLFFDVMQALRGYTPQEISKLTIKKSKGNKTKQVTTGTIIKWFIPVKDGGTKYPQARTLENALNAVGGSLKVVPPINKEKTEIQTTTKAKKKHLTPNAIVSDAIQ